MTAHETATVVAALRHWLVMADAYRDKGGVDRVGFWRLVAANDGEAFAPEEAPLERSALVALIERLQNVRPIPADLPYIEAARRIWGKDGAIEFDDEPGVSVSEEGGAYVEAWVWVYDDDAGVVREGEE